MPIKKFFFIVLFVLIVILIFYFYYYVPCYSFLSQKVTPTEALRPTCCSRSEQSTMPPATSAKRLMDEDFR